MASRKVSDTLDYAYALELVVRYGRNAMSYPAELVSNDEKDR
jgi:hypothetical protein